MPDSLVKSLRIDAELWAKVRARADLREITPNAWVVRCIRDTMKRLETAEAKPEIVSRLKKR